MYKRMNEVHHETIEHFIITEKNLFIKNKDT